MNCLKFTQKDGFTSTPDPLDSVCAGDNYERQLQAAGYNRDRGVFAQYGDENDEVQVQVYRRENTEHFLVNVGDAMTGSATIVVEGEPDLFALHLRLGSLLSVSLQSQLREGIDMARKAFRAWHGHDNYRPCPKCDPQGWEADEQFRRERAAKSKG